MIVLAALLTVLFGVFLWAVFDWTYASMVLLAIAVLFAMQDFNKEAVILLATVTIFASLHLLVLVWEER
jgi:uncharacterized membrane protein YdbT with pleckstrin-like domain